MPSPLIFIEKVMKMSLTLKEITDIANDYTDEQFTETKVKRFANKAISIINTEVRATLPLFSTTVVTYTYLTDSWINRLIVPYVCYSIKMNDGSLNEADRFLLDFKEGLAGFIKERDFAVPDAYKSDDFDGIYRIDHTIPMNVGWNNFSNEDEDW